MIAIRVQREPSDSGATLGALYVNDRFVCWTLEDMVREPADRPMFEAALSTWVKSWKQFGVTAVPAGRYPVVMEFSPKFQRDLPELKFVPGFTEVKIHAGNSDKDTDGCILVGLGREDDRLTRSQDALAKLLSRLRAFPGEQILIDIHNAPGRHYEGPTTKGLKA